VKTFEQIPKNDGQLNLLQVAKQFGIVQETNFPIPGRFYSLVVESPAVVLEESQVLFHSEGKPYYDLAPCGLVLYQPNWEKADFALILNLRMMSPTASAAILGFYHKFAAKHGLQNLYRDGELLALKERMKPENNHPFYFTPAFFTLLDRDLNFVINKYKINQIKETRLIDWDNFGMLVRPNFSRAGIFPENIDEEVFRVIDQKLNA